MKEEKKYLDGIQSPIQKRSIKDIPVPARNKSRLPIGNLKTQTSTVPIIKKSKPNLNLREEPQKDSVGDFLKITREDKLRKEQADVEASEYDFDEDDVTRGSSKKVWLAIIGGIIVLIAIFFGLSTLLAKAQITITPKTDDLNNLSVDIPIIDEKIANKDLLNYKVLEITESATKTVASESEEDVEIKASGVITVYNEFNKEGQKLIQNTRFETTDGLIYRIKNSITVPGYTDNGGSKVPGSVEVQVFADEAGPKYNIGKFDFKIPGFKGQPQYDLFYAKSKGEITGGFVGTKNTISTSTLATLSKELQGNITEKIISNIKGQNTDNYTYVYSPDKFTFLEPRQENGVGKKVQVSVTGSIGVYVISKADLSTKVAEKESRGYNGDPVLISNFDALTFKINSNDIVSGSTVIPNNEVLNVSGNPKLVWQNDIEKLKNDLAGKDKSDLSKVVSNYSGIAKAQAILKWIWSGKFPNKTSRINVEITQ